MKLERSTKVEFQDMLLQKMLEILRSYLKVKMFIMASFSMRQGCRIVQHCLFGPLPLSTCAKPFVFYGH